MDPYIINNMPDDDDPPIPVGSSDMTMTTTLDETQSIVFDLVDDGNGYVIVASVNDADKQQSEGAVIMCFDPTLDLAKVVSLIMTFRHSNVITMSGDAAAAVASVIGDANP